jgi:hypothetical protein
MAAGRGVWHGALTAAVLIVDPRQMTHEYAQASITMRHERALLSAESEVRPLVLEVVRLAARRPGARRWPCSLAVRLNVARWFASSQPVEALVVDDTGFAKDGPASPCVARQYSGTLGKVANC